MLSVFLFTAAMAQNKNVTFQVDNPDSTQVYVFGSWSGWGNWPGTPMTNLGNGKFSVTISIPANATHEFLFVNGSPATPIKETLDSLAPCTNGNPQYTNRVFAMGANDTAIC